MVQLKTVGRKLARIPLIVCLCISLLPANSIAFADSVQSNTRLEQLNEAALFSSLDSDTEAFLDNADSYVEGRDYAENQMIVSFDIKQFDIPADEGLTNEVLTDFDYGSGILNACGYSIMGVIPGYDSCVQVLADLPEGISVKEAILDASENARVIGACPNYYFNVEESLEGGSGQVPSDPCFSNSGSWVYELTSVRKAWSYQKTDNGVTIAIIDGGFNLSHPDLNGRIDTSLAYDAGDSAPLTQNSLRAQEPYTSHGTAVAAAAAATVNNGLGNAGTSYNAKVLPIAAAVKDNANLIEYQSIIRGLQYISTLKESGKADDLKILNMSFGNYSSIRDTAYQKLLSHLRNDLDILIVASAGNTTPNNSAYDNTEFHQPSDFDECISVTAVNKSGLFMQGYAHNEYKDIAAPGAGYYLPQSGSSYYGYFSGTSFASPHVAGVAALIRSANSSLSAGDVERLLYATARDAGKAGRDDYYGFGILDAESAVMRACGINYTDIDSDEWYVYQGYLKYVTQHKLLTGYSGTTLFGPHDDTTRAQVVAVLYRIACPEEQTNDPSHYGKNETPFVDCEDYQWYTNAVNWAAHNNILRGDSSTNYTTARPNDCVSREELAVLLSRYAESIGLNTSVEDYDDPITNDWNDVDVWARNAMKWCYYHQVISGWDNGDGTVSTLPFKNSDRAQLSKVMTFAHKGFPQ